MPESEEALLESPRFPAVDNKGLGGAGGGGMIALRTAGASKSLLGIGACRLGDGPCKTFGVGGIGMKPGGGGGGGLQAGRPSWSPRAHVALAHSQGVNCMAGCHLLLSQSLIDHPLRTAPVVRL